LHRFLKMLRHILLFFLTAIALTANAQMRPVIGLSDTYKDGVSTVPRTYIEAVMAAGGLPVIIPLMQDEKKLNELLESLDGVIFTGGGDFDPAYYHETPIPQNGRINAPRDAFDIRLLQIAVEKGVPVLGICRGLQLINIAFGGSLYQDLPAQFPVKQIAHRQKMPASNPSHTVNVLSGTEFSKIVGNKPLYVNSAHHQAVKALAPGFKIAGKSPDGVVEAIEQIDDKQWVLGVQFHPEALYARDKRMSSIIRSLVDEASLNRAKRNAKQIVYVPVETPKTTPAADTNLVKVDSSAQNLTGLQDLLGLNPEPVKVDSTAVIARHEAITPSDTLKLTKTALLDKIKGGWAGQTLGVCFGAPTEFRWCGVPIPDSIMLHLNADLVKKYFNNDDIYMDLTFVSIIARLGIDAPVDSFAMAFAQAGYNLWHANQSARYNILHGLTPPASGHWHNNPHADDIDYQIESDFAGLMSPAMPNAASAISDRIGHIMNYGDGWYGGVFVGAMYALAFTTDDIPYIVEQALSTIPPQSKFYKCIDSVIENWKKFPDDWKKAWQACQNGFSEEHGCPDGVFLPFNIDASINAAYIVLGLLYGEGDFQRTLEIATRAGQDSDCNPSSAGGILGVIKGYSNLPTEHLHPIEDTKLSYTDYSLNEVYQISYSHALQNIERNGGKILKNEVVIIKQSPDTVRFEQSFEGLAPAKRMDVNKKLDKSLIIKFKGSGIVVRGGVKCPADNDYVAQIQVSIDGKIVETVEMPTNFLLRRNEVFWNYQLKNRRFKLELKWLNPRADAAVTIHDALIYSKQKTK